MLQKLLPLAVVLLILATSAIACSNLTKPNRADAQPQLNQTISAQETEEFRKLLVDYYAAWSIPTNKPWNITMAEKFYQRNDRMFGFDFNPPAEGFQGWKAYKRELTSNNLLDKLQQIKLLANIKQRTIEQRLKF